jgi:hypothetical protein
VHTPFKLTALELIGKRPQGDVDGPSDAGQALIEHLRRVARAQAGKLFRPLAAFLDADPGKFENRQIGDKHRHGKQPLETPEIAGITSPRALGRQVPGGARGGRQKLHRDGQRATATGGMPFYRLRP